MRQRAMSNSRLGAIVATVTFLTMVATIPVVFTVFGQSSQSQQTPQAHAGPAQTVSVGNTVLLDGSGSSDMNGDLLTFNWTIITKPEGSAAVIGNPTWVMPSFDIDEPGIYIAQLIVNDGTANSVPDMVVITTENSAPVANAGQDQKAVVGDTVILDGSGHRGK